MKKNIVFIVIILYILIGCGLFCFLIIPGIKDINKYNNFYEYSSSEKMDLINNIKQKYDGLIKEENEIYNNSLDEINLKYDNLVNDKKKDFENKEKEIQKKYDDLEKDINSQKNKISVLQNNEFFAHGLSEKYYDLQNQWININKELSSLSLKENAEINENNDNKLKSINKLNDDRNGEISLKYKDNSSKIELFNLEMDKEIKDIENINEKKNCFLRNGLFKIIGGFILILIPIIYVIIVFNKLTHLSNKVEESWSQIDVYLKKRADLIPNIVKVVKECSVYENNTFSNISSIRSKVVNSKDKNEEIKASKEFDNKVKEILILNENYPELNSNKNFMDLQNDLRCIEDSIARERYIYNNNVLKYKNKLEKFPSNLVGYLFKFKDEMFFGTDEKEVNVVF